jgi:3-deoxy-manno-octulosonate cytidylyltransferase (CMP-KDO synthetase)
MRIAGIIPARYASTRFPGKPLADILGKPMIQHVYERALQSKYLNRVVVATDDERIFHTVKNFGGHAVITSTHHNSGTERCLEALQNLDEPFQYVINIQGDEPLISAEQIDELAAALQQDMIEIATQIIKVRDAEQLFSPSEVKVVINTNSEALYFSRQPIPYLKNHPQHEWHLHHAYYRHAGMYAYRADILEKISTLPVSSLEAAESLEQLRWLQYGFTIKCILTENESLCVDTPEDLHAVVKRFKEISS